MNNVLAPARSTSILLVDELVLRLERQMNKISRLQVNSETVRTLTRTELKNANGGFTGPSAFYSDCCYPATTTDSAMKVAQSDVSCAPSCADHGCA